MMDGSFEQPLCCCEYINSRGERAHLFGLFCDCTEVDDFVDRVVKGLPVPNTRNEEILATLEDRYVLFSLLVACVEDIVERSHFLLFYI